MVYACLERYYKEYTIKVYPEDPNAGCGLDFIITNKQFEIQLGYPIRNSLVGRHIV